MSQISPSSSLRSPSSRGHITIFAISFMGPLSSPLRSAGDAYRWWLQVGSSWRDNDSVSRRDWVQVWRHPVLLEKLREKWSKVEKQPCPAMYSSTYGGIILDPALMVIPIDDHMVHRGHGFLWQYGPNGMVEETSVVHHLDVWMRKAWIRST